MKLNFEGMEKIGEGEEKEVYIHPQDESKVLSRFKYEASHTEREMKGRFYLTKIVHIFFPNHIPDSSLSVKGESAILVSEKKEVNESHKKHSALRMDYRKTANPSIKEHRAYDRSLKKEQERLLQDDQYKNLLIGLVALGIKPDPEVSNFAYEENGNLIYLDNDFEPWRIRVNREKMKGAMIKNYNREKILEASDTLDEAAREKIKIYLDRLDILFEEERTEKNYI